METIAHFMGLWQKKDDRLKNWYVSYAVAYSVKCRELELKYNSDWNEIWPVIEKINNSRFNVTIDSNSVSIRPVYGGPSYFSKQVLFGEKPKIEVVCSLIIEFVQAWKEAFSGHSTSLGCLQVGQEFSYNGSDVVYRVVYMDEPKEWGNSQMIGYISLNSEKVVLRDLFENFDYNGTFTEAYNRAVNIL